MSLRVLLADDHLVLEQALRVVLERVGFEVVAQAPDGRTAVELACRFQPHVAVMDVARPVLNGVEAARVVIRACPRSRVILLTALNDARFVPDALRAGVASLVNRPSTTLTGVYAGLLLWTPQAPGWGRAKASRVCSRRRRRKPV